MFVSGLRIRRAWCSFATSLWKHRNSVRWGQANIKTSCQQFCLLVLYIGIIFCQFLFRCGHVAWTFILCLTTRTVVQCFKNWKSLCTIAWRFCLFDTLGSAHIVYIGHILKPSFLIENIVESGIKHHKPNLGLNRSEW